MPRRGRSVALRKAAGARGRIAVGLLVVAMTALACSAQPQTGTPAQSAPAPTTSDVIPTQQPDVADLVGDVSVTALPYGLPNATGYDTAVTFTVVNPSDFPMVSPYRVTVTGGGKTLDTTDGNDEVVLAPHQQLLVVNRPNGVRDTPPDAATVSFYSNEAGQMALPDPAGWKLSNVTTPSCDGGFVGCEVNADLVYDGETNIDMQLKINSVRSPSLRTARPSLPAT